jgi:hypothetical protein
VPDLKRTTASRRRGPRSAWSLSLSIFAGTAAVAAVIVSDWGGGVSEASVWLARALVIAGGSLTGILAPRATSTRGRVAALLVPIPLLAVVGVLMAGLSQSADDLPEVGRILAIALFLFDIPMAVAFGIRASRSARRSEVLFAPSGTIRDEDGQNHEWDLELDRATNHGRAATVVREYLEDEEGKAHLEVDAKGIEARGYESVSIEHIRPGLAQVGLELLIGIAGIPAGDSEAKIVATFRLRSAQDDGSLVQSPGSMVAVISSAKFGCLSVGLIVAWTAAGVIIMAAGFLALGALEPNQVEGNPIGSIPPLVGLIVAFLGSVLSIRWLRARG